MTRSQEECRMATFLGVGEGQEGRAEELPGCLVSYYPTRHAKLMPTQVGRLAQTHGRPAKQLTRGVERGASGLGD